VNKHNTLKLEKEGTTSDTDEKRERERTQIYEEEEEEEEEAAPMCHPGRPGPQGLSHVGSPGFAVFHSAKSVATLLPVVPSSSTTPALAFASGTRPAGWSCQNEGEEGE
jgi:hypothetical protein